MMYQQIQKITPNTITVTSLFSSRCQLLKVAFIVKFLCTLKPALTHTSYICGAQ